MQRRLELGLRQPGLAKLLGVNEMSVVGWEKGWHGPSEAYSRKIGEPLYLPSNRRWRAIQS